MSTDIHIINPQLNNDNDNNSYLGNFSLAEIAINTKPSRIDTPVPLPRALKAQKSKSSTNIEAQTPSTNTFGLAKVDEMIIIMRI